MSKMPEEARKTLSAFKRLMYRIDTSSRPDPAPGHVLNCFGSYDDAKLTDELLQVLSGAQLSGPQADYVRYLYAAALNRARRFPESIQTYRSLSNGHGTYAEAASLMVVLPLWNSGDLEAAQAALEAHNATYTPDGKAPQFRSAREMCVPGTRL